MSQDNNLYKIWYKHNELPIEKITFYSVQENTPPNELTEVIRAYLFHTIHRYTELPNGDSNGERSHGTFSFEYCEVSRYDDSQLDKLISAMTKVVETDMEKLTKYQNMKNEPFQHLTDIIKVQ